MRNWRPRWVALLITMVTLSVFGESAGYLTHVTSRGLESVRSLLDMESAYLQRLPGFSKGRTNKAELSSIQHQKDVVNSVRGGLRSRLEKEGFTYKQYHRGVVDSDMGKLPEFKNLLTEKSPKSDQLLSFLKLQGSAKSKKVLLELLNKFPAKQRALLNPSLTNDQLRSIFKKNPVLQHYLHEFPGMADPLYFFEEGIIDEYQFKQQLKTNMFHNGPHAGFWKFYSEVTIPGLVGKDPRGKKFFLNTAYEGGKNKKGFILPSYPGPISFEGYVHVIFDRLSQGTRGGVDKIFEEIRVFPGQSDVEKMTSLLFDNPLSTQDQFSALYDLALEDPALKENQRKAVKELIETSQARLNAYIAFVTQRFALKVEKNVPVLVIKPNDKEVLAFKSTGDKHSIKAADQKLRQVANSNAFGDELKETVVKLLIEEEKLNGNLLKDLDL